MRKTESVIAPESLASDKRAAELEERSLSDFVVSAAREATRRTIEDSYILRLSVEDQRRFVDLLLDPLEPASALERAKTAHDILVLESK